MLLQFQNFLYSVRNCIERSTQILCSPRATVAFWLAVSRAEARFISTGVRQYVIPSSSHRVLLVTDFNHEIHSQGLDMSRKSGFHTRNLSKPQTLMDMAFYWTRSHRCRYRWRRSMSPAAKSLRRDMFYDWWNSKPVKQ